MNYEGFQGDKCRTPHKKFGVRNTDELTLSYQRRYDDFVQPIIDQFSVGESRKRPRDLMRET